MEGKEREELGREESHIFELLEISKKCLSANSVDARFNGTETPTANGCHSTSTAKFTLRDACESSRGTRFKVGSAHNTLVLPHFYDGPYPPWAEELGSWCDDPDSRVLCDGEHDRTQRILEAEEKYYERVTGLIRGA